MLPFELTGGPARWQWFINNMLWEYLNKFCTAYLDNILIYNSNLKKHKEHLQLVLAKFCKFSVQANVEKCKFHVTKTKYLRLIISTKGIKIDSAKIEAIKQWDTFICVQEVCSFVRFYNFYKWFIRNFSNIVGSLNSLTKKNMLFTRTNECKQVFQ